MGRRELLFVTVAFLLYTSGSEVFALRRNYFDLGIKSIPKSAPSKYEKWFTQNLDHFNPNDERTWQQRYYVNEEYADGNKNVVFLMIGGEGTASDFWMTNGSWIGYAKEFKAILFEVEHRFYGKSHPLENLSNENLVYLTSQQALGDLAIFIEAMNVQYSFSADTKWIIFGGSYSGNLAAWVRLQYPHLVHGAMSASGPLLAQLDFPEYLKVVADALRASDETCPDIVQQAIDQVEVLLRDVDGPNRVNKLFKLCSDIDITNELDLSNFFEAIADNFAGVVQYNQDNIVSRKSLNITTDRVCEIMTNQSIGSELERLAAVNDWMLHNSNDSCLDYKYDKMIEGLRNVSWSSEAASGGRQWTYQTCTEFGYFQTTTYQPQIFGNRFNISFFIRQCEDIFGPKYNQTFLEQAIHRTNVLYGGLDIEVTNVVFVHGSLDPWHVLGITETLTNEAPAILIEGAAHCSNLYNPSDDDTPQLKAARVQVQQLIGTWLNRTNKFENSVSNFVHNLMSGIVGVFHKFI